MNCEDCVLCSSRGREYLREPEPTPGHGEWSYEIPLCRVHWRMALEVVLDQIDAQDRSTVPCVVTESGVQPKREKVA